MRFEKQIRRSAFSFAVALATLAIFLSHNVGHANLLLNGSFESPVVTPGTPLTVSPGGEPAGFDWLVGTGNIDLAGSNPFVLFAFYDGIQTVDLSGNVKGSLYQDFGTASGQTYSLTFAYADNPLEGGISSADVVVTDLTNSTTLLSIGVTHSTSANPSFGDWTIFTGSFTAGSTSTRLRFNSTSASGGILLDDVVVQVPKPSSLLLACVGIFGLATFYRRRTR